MICGLHVILTAIWQSGTILFNWTRELVGPIWKGKENSQDCNNYCSITYLIMAGKVLAHVAYADSQLTAEQQRPEQSWFLSGKSAADYYSTSCADVFSSHSCPNICFSNSYCCCPLLSVSEVWHNRHQAKMSACVLFHSYYSLNHSPPYSPHSQHHFHCFSSSSLLFSLQVKYVKQVLGEDVNSQLLVQCLGATSLVGRLAFGLIADRPWVNRILLQQVTMKQDNYDITYLLKSYSCHDAHTLPAIQGDF